MESVLCNCSAHEYNRRCYSLILEGIASHSNVDAQTCPPVLSAVCDVVRSVRALTPPSARCATPARQRQSFRSPFASPLPCLLVLHLRRPSSLSSLSSFTATQAPCRLASSLADVLRFARIRWLTPQKHTPRYLSGRVMHVVLDASPVGPLLGRPHVSSDM